MGFHACAHYNGAGDAFTVAEEIITQDKGTHGMSKDKIGFMVILFFCEFLESVYVTYHYIGRVLVGEVTGTVIYNGFTMSQVVVRCDKKAFFTHVFGEIFVSVYVLAHAVNNLKNGYRIPGWNPAYRMNLVDPVSGIEIEIFSFIVLYT